MVIKMGLADYLTNRGVILAQGDWNTNSDYVEDGVVKVQAIEPIITKVLGLIVPIAGVILLLMLIVGGFQYITSGGEVEQANKAKKTLTYAFLGLIVILGAWLIMLFLEEFTGLNLTEFSIPK
jgi:hypothetical protein